MWLNTYVLNLAIDSRFVWSFTTGGLVQSGGELLSWMDGTFDGWGDVLADRRDILDAEGGIPEGGVWGVSNSSEFRAGLPNPDSLLNKICYE